MATQSTTQAQRRGELVALAGIALQVVLTIVVLLLAVLTNAEEGPADPTAVAGGSVAMWAECAHLGAGIGLWIVLWLVFNQRKRLQREILETEALRGEREIAGTGGAIFDVDDEELMLSRRRLKSIYRWLLPGFTIFLALQLAISALTANWPLGRHVLAEDWATVNPEWVRVALGVVVVLALFTFLFSRYATGLARLPQWRMLRAGASYTLGNTVMLFLLAVALFLNDTPAVEHVLAYVIRGLMLFLAFELLLNFVLDLYRPRALDDEPRPAFESRLLGLLSEPGAVAHSIAEAINYQFGFEVSTTWFYKLMQRAIVPLFAFGAGVLILLSTVVVVEPHEQAVIERWGQPLRDDDGTIAALSPGIHLKWPWPVERAYRHPVRRVQRIVLGLHAEDDDGHADEHDEAGRLILWTEQDHWGEEHENILVAAPEAATQTGGAPTATQPVDAPAARAVPVSIVQVVVPLNYTISDVGRYAYGYADSKALLEAVAYRELVRLAASMDLLEIMGERREWAAAELRKRIETRVGPGGLDMGVTIGFVGLDGLHPPHEVAESFQSVVGAQIEEEALTLAAEAEAINIKIQVAGSVALAKELDAAITGEEGVRRRISERRADGAAEDEIRGLEAQADQAQAEARELLLAETAGGAQVGGLAAVRILDARARRWELENKDLARVEQFKAELAGYQSAPELYRWRRLLGVLATGLRGVKKYVITVETNGVPEMRFHDQATSPALNWTLDETGSEATP